jgi:hypothetical protein
LAFETGTATNFADLYNKLRDFLTTNADLVTAGQEWLQIAGPGGALTDADEIVLQGPGTAGADEILVGLKCFTSVGSDYYNLAMYGLTAYNGALGGIASQIGVTRPGVVHGWDDPMPYWFVANGRRFIVVIRVASVYQSGYAGFILPYVLPTLWPYPLFVGASAGSTSARYSDTGDARRNPFHPGEGGSCCCMPDNRFLEFWNANVTNNGTGDGTGNTFSDRVRLIAPFATDAAEERENLDGSYTLHQVALVGSEPYAAQFGGMQGVFRVSGFANASENIVEIDGVDHLVVQNVYRVDNQNFAAIRLE